MKPSKKNLKRKKYVRKPFKVDIIESEAGWGQRIDETIGFETVRKAENFIKKYNSRNTSKVVPSYYTYATKASSY